MTDILAEIAAYKRAEVAALRRETSQDAIEAAAQAASSARL